MSKNIVEFVAQFSAKQNSSFVKARKGVDDIQKKINNVNKTKIAPKVSNKSKGGFSSLSSSVGDLQGKLGGLVSGMPMVGGSLSGLLTAVNPVTLAIGALGAAVVGVGTHLIGVQKEIDNTRKKFTRFVEANNIDVVTAKVTALQRTFDDMDVTELSKAQKTIQKEFGIDGVEAVELLQKAMVATNGAIDLDNVTEYASQIKKTGGSAEDLLAIISLSENEGFYQDKGIDAVKEFNLRFSEMGKGASDALKKVGINGEELLSKVQSGTMTQKEAFSQIFGQMDKLDAKSQQILTAGILGAPGEDLGVKGIMAIANMEGGLDSLIAKQGESAKRQQKLLDLNGKLAKSQVKTANALRPVFQLMEETWIKVQTAFSEFLEPVIAWIVDVGRDLATIFGPFLESTIMRLKMALMPIITSLKVAFTVIGGIIKLIASIVKGFVKLANFLKDKVKKAIKSVLGQENIDKIKRLWKQAFVFIGAKWNQLSTMMKASFDAITEGLSGNWKEADKAFARAMKARKALLSSSTVRFDTEDKDEKKKTKDEDKETPIVGPTIDTSGVDGSITDTIDSKVSGASSSVKNIKIEIENLGNFEGATLTTENLADFEAQLTQALLRVANSVNSI